MNDLDRQETQQEPELAPLVCPACATEVAMDTDSWPENCPNCNRPFDLRAQFAFCRGRDAFIAGQELIIHIAPTRREKNMTTSDEMEGVQYYIQGYTALQQAFQGELAESQRQLGIEMVAAMVRVFQQHGMVSPLEAAYWSYLMVEMISQLECETLAEKLANPRRGIIGAVLRWRWQTRKTQLEKALAQIDAKVRLLERQIKFVEKPRARRLAR
jgi:hypothetical protein